MPGAGCESAPQLPVKKLKVTFADEVKGKNNETPNPSEAPKLPLTLAGCGRESDPPMTANRAAELEAALAAAKANNKSDAKAEKKAAPKPKANGKSQKPKKAHHQRDDFLESEESDSSEQPSPSSDGVGVDGKTEPKRGTKPKPGNTKKPSDSVNGKSEKSGKAEIPEVPSEREEPQDPKNVPEPGAKEEKPPREVQAESKAAKRKKGAEAAEAKSAAEMRAVAFGAPKPPAKRKQRQTGEVAPAVTGNNEKAQFENNGGPASGSTEKPSKRTKSKNESEVDNGENVDGKLDEAEENEQKPKKGGTFGLVGLRSAFWDHVRAAQAKILEENPEISKREALQKAKAGPGPHSHFQCLRLDSCWSLNFFSKP